ncbi:unnamed protein product [Parnassius apollo]|uniref:(apollo) hypothetical protein n=1 Tax=Parnassius apollo TaxID=110799 RepID=A0A8S3X0R2_PARAO|nr:unnamed protein product [Parnassius apollo]
METRHFWEENGHAVKYENYNSNDGFGRISGEQLKFTAPSEDEGEYSPGAYLKKREGLEARPNVPPHNREETTRSDE